MNSLTQELQSSGVDLSQASISVQINVSKSANSGLNAAASNSKVCFQLERPFVALKIIHKSIIWGDIWHTDAHFSKWAP